MRKNKKVIGIVELADALTLARYVKTYISEIQRELTSKEKGMLFFAKRVEQSAHRAIKQAVWLRKLLKS